ncbi:MAG TPA: phospholipase D family protein [Steroidobacteraceae bacterium]|nr:phospholipase D family protein [Steroidobacteraceae bacterium]
MPRVTALCCLLLLCGCTTLPGRDYPRPPSPAATEPANPALLHPYLSADREHPAESGFHLYSAGIDGLLLRLELIEAAHSSLDLQYYIFHGDESGKLITEALSRAAARGVRVRVLVDDGETIPGDEQLFALAGARNVEIRVFNPWRYRGHNGFLRGVEYLFSHARLDFRMHNKLFIADRAVALVGGRNIGDEYFQVDPGWQFADDDVLTTGPAVQELAVSFEQFWQSQVAIPVQALLPARDTSADAAEALAQRVTVPKKAQEAGVHYEEKLAAHEPLASVLAGHTALDWADAEVLADSPYKGLEQQKSVRISSLLFGPVAQAIHDTRSELTLVTPYLVPAPDEMKLLEDLRRRGCAVRILTTSLEAESSAVAQAGYMHYRKPLLESGVQLYEIRARPENPRGTGQPEKLSRYGHYSLHAKQLVFDRNVTYLGSMNYDQRSRRLNTENGLIIHSTPLAEATARRFDLMTQPQNAYAVSLQEQTPGDAPELTWSTVKSGQPLVLHEEPARSGWQRFEVHFLALFPIDREL